MASPQLKKTAVVGPPRKLINSGVVPTTQVRLKGINGQTIKPKLPTAPTKKKAAAPADSEEKEPLSPAPEAASSPAPEAEAPAPESSPAAEAPEATPAAEEAAPEAAAEGPSAEELEYQRQMEEYNRQMEEYNRQMEEYNRQLAKQAEEEAKAAAEKEAEEPAPEPSPVKAEEPTPEPPPVEAEDPAPEPPPVKAEEPTPEEPAVKAEEPAPEPPPVKAEEPAPEPPPVKAEEPAPEPPPVKAVAKKVAKPTLAVKKPGALKRPAGGAKRAAAAPPSPAPAAKAPDSPEAADQEPDAEQDTPPEPPTYMYTSTPIYKKTGFLIACGFLVLFSAVCGYLVVNANAEQKRMIAQNERVMGILRRARKINEKQIESLSDAKKKGVDVSCTLEEATFLMNVVVNPAMKDEKGKAMFGSRPEDTAQLACLLIGIACEADNDISKMIFERLSTDAPKIKPSLYRWLVQRLAAANIKGINSKLHKLAKNIAQNDSKSFRTRNELLSYIWESMGLRVTEKDIPAIADLLKDEELDKKLANTLLNCLHNIVRMAPDASQRPQIGDKIFDALPDFRRPDAADAMGLAGSPKALAYFTQRAEDSDNWRSDRLFFSNYSSDDILPFLETLKQKAAGDKKKEAHVDAMILGLFRQNRERSVETATRLLALIPAYDKIGVDTSEWDDIVEKTDPNAGTFISESDPQYNTLMQKKQEIEPAINQKMALVNQLSAMFDYAWVCHFLEKFANEPTRELSAAAKRALEKTRANRAEDNELHAKYNSRDKE
ncbi:MAG: hypothetical protein J1E42_02965 [Akkermansiaceae bacterium]|nr:hypothetical protein [Akkermansiaceae bacterium]